MLFAISYRPLPASEEQVKRSLALFTNWTPPAGPDIKAHYALASGGGIAIVEADSAAPIVEGLAPWAGVHLDFDVSPAMDITEAVPLFLRANAWRDSIR